MSSKTQGKTGRGNYLRDFVTNESALPVVGRACYCWVGGRLLVCCYALEAVGNGEVPLDQAANLLDRQASVLWEGFQHLLECLKGWESIQKAFHKLLLLLPWDSYALSSCATGCPSVASRYSQPESAGDPRRASLRSFCTRAATLRDSPIPLTARRWSSQGSSRYAAKHRYRHRAATPLHQRLQSPHESVLLRDEGGNCALRQATWPDS
jgi:hypothetical protein